MAPVLTRSVCAGSYLFSLLGENVPEVLDDLRVHDHLPLIQAHLSYHSNKAPTWVRQTVRDEVGVLKETSHSNSSLVRRISKRRAFPWFIKDV